MTKVNNSTVNKDEVLKFSAIAEEWWDTNGKFKPLHQINPIRLEYIISQIKANNRSKTDSLRILDIGCGGGLVSVPLAKLGYNVTGVDASEENIKIASTRDSSAKFINSTIEQLAIENKTFDVVLALEVLEHVDNIELFLSSCEKVLEKNGILIISTINRTLKSLMFAKVAAEYILRWVPIGTHSWDKFLTPEEVQRNVNARLVDTTGMVYSPLSKSWKLSDADTSVNYFMTFKK